MGDQPLPCMSVSQIQQSLRESVRKVVEKCTTNLFMFLASLGTTLVKTNPPAPSPRWNIFLGISFFTLTPSLKWLNSIDFMFYIKFIYLSHKSDRYTWPEPDILYFLNKNSPRSRLNQEGAVPVSGKHWELVSSSGQYQNFTKTSRQK